MLYGTITLSKVSECVTDPALLLGAGISVDDLGDDALGRALEKFGQAGPAAVFSAVAARAYAVEGIDRGGMHWDSTARSPYGRYPTADGTTGVTPGMAIRTTAPT